MKKLLIGSAVVIVLIVATAFVIPFFVPLDTYRAKIIALVKDETGRDLRIDGPVKFSLLPRVVLEANAVALSNPAGASTPNMMQLKALAVTLRILPLLHGAIEVDQFKLVEPAIALEVDKEGRPNWAFSRPVQPAARAAPLPSEPPAKGGGVPAISLDDVSIVNGQASYLDQRSGEKRVITDINLQLSLPDLAGPFNAKGGATWNAEPLALTFVVAHPGALVGGGASPVALSIASRPVNFDFRGDATGATLAKLVGTIDLSVPSVRGLAKWVGVPFAAPGTGFGALSIAGKIAVADQKMAFTEAALALDAIKATGALTLDSHGARPYLAGRLDIDKLDVNPYLPVEQPATSAMPTGATEAAPAPSGLSTPAASPHGWSDAPIELSGLKTADADFDLSANSILFRKIEIGKSALAMHLKNGRFEADLSDMELYQGKGKGNVVADGSAPIPAVTAAFNLTGIAIQPLFRDAAAFERLTGIGAFVLDVAGHGRSEREIVASLNGKGSLNLADGKIEGVNFVDFMKNAAAAMTGGHGGANETDFGTLTGTYTIGEGMLHNNDLKLISPELPMSGAGSVDLPLRQVDYRLTPSLAGLIAVPVSITGSWDDLSYRPDLSAMGKTLIEQPGKAFDLLKNGLLGR
jgi:AsmA protein